jgi:hypothetical protein
VSGQNSVRQDGRWVDYDYGQRHHVCHDAPSNITMADSGVKFDISSALIDGFLDLAYARPFAILAATEILNLGSTTCLGDLGLLNSAIAVAAGISVSGSVEWGSNTAQVAITAAGSLKAAAAKIPCGTTHTGLEANMAGRTYAPGVHCWTPPNVWLTGGDIYLDAGGDADAYWVFYIEGNLTVGSNARPQTVHVINGGSACNVFWVVGGDMKMHGSSSLHGTVVAGATVTILANATLLGGVISVSASVSLTDAYLDNTLCSFDTRDLHNISFAIWDAEIIPLPLTTNSTVLTWSDLVGGFEIVRTTSLHNTLLLSISLPYVSCV